MPPCGPFCCMRQQQLRRGTNASPINSEWCIGPDAEARARISCEPAQRSIRESCWISIVASVSCRVVGTHSALPITHRAVARTVRRHVICDVCANYASAPISPLLLPSAGSLQLSSGGPIPGISMVREQGRAIGNTIRLVPLT